MRLALSFVHQSQFYVGGLLKRAAKRLGIDCYSIGTHEGSWICGAPVEPLSAPDVVLPKRGLHEMHIDADALVYVDQGDGLAVRSSNGVPTAAVLSEGNSGDLARCGWVAPKAAWSCMPYKPETRSAHQGAGIRTLFWGFDPENTPLTPWNVTRDIDVHHRGTPTDVREHYYAGIGGLAGEGFVSLLGWPVSRQQWGDELRRSKTTVADHDPFFLTGRLVDAAAAGCLLLCRPSPMMDELFGADGYVPLKSVPWPNRYAAVDAGDLVAQIRRYARDDAARGEICDRAQAAVRNLSWDEQLLRILDSIGVRP